MNKNAIRNYATWARKELIDRVSQRAYEYDITVDGDIDASAAVVNGRVLTGDEKRQRTELIRQVEQKGYNQMMEEVAYTWFNRFIALRFMEVNNYLPSHIRVFSNEEGAFKPDILHNALYMDLEGLDKAKVATLLENNQTEDLYRYLLLTQCNALNACLPQMFERVGGYTELLFPNNILKEDSVLGRLVSDIPEEDWTDQVQIIGWLYQFYNTELKAEVFAKNGKVSKTEIPAVTQLFTPDWIVRYMVENSLGRLWLERCNTQGDPADTHRNASDFGWKYYLEDAEQETDAKAQLQTVRETYRGLNHEDIKIIDPCMGSGHILVYAFDVLMTIYEDAGWSPRDAAQSILRNNLFGLDIDDRAAQLAYFAVMMKARQYDRRLFSRGIQPQVLSVAESNEIDSATVEYVADGDPTLKADLEILIRELYDAKEYGSILKVSAVDFDALKCRMKEIANDISMYRQIALDTVLPLIRVAEVMAQRYHITVTNPPYMALSSAKETLNNFVKRQYPDSKTDMFAVFIERCAAMLKPNGFQAMITMHSWMFLSSYERLRNKLLACDTVNMVHLGARAFEEIGGEVVQTTAFVFRNVHTDHYKGIYCRLTDPVTQDGKEALFLSGESRYVAAQSAFSKIPGAPIAYWVSPRFVKCFEEGRLGEYVTAVKGLDTCDNDRFTRFWFEVISDRISYQTEDNAGTFCHKWFPYCKGGGYSKWYGFMEKVVDWECDGKVLRNLRDESGKIKSRPQNTRYYFKEGLTWSTITSYKLSLRYMNRCVFGGGGSAMFTDRHLFYYLAFVNSKVSEYALHVLNPTLNILVGDILSLPLILDEGYTYVVNETANRNVALSKEDWDSFETSWDFKKHPLV